MLIGGAASTVGWAGEPPLSNEDVVKLIRAGLSEDVVISKIKTSATRFDLSTDALIQLRKVGLSNAVLTAMMSSGATPPVAPTTGPGSPDWPESYGVFLKGPERLVKLEAKPVSHVVGIRVAGSSARGSAVDGVAGDPEVSVPNNMLEYLMVHEPNSDPRRYVLSRLRYVEKMQAYQFNLGTDPAFFSTVWGVSPTKVIDVNLWRRSSSASLEVAPVSNTPDLYKLTPSTLLRGGRYFLHDPSLLHDHDVVFSFPASAAKGFGYYFTVAPPKLDEEARD